MGISKKDLERIDHTTRNTTAALVFSILMGIFSFVERTVFNQFFLTDYLGLSSFFNNVMTILSATELGLYTSISYALYAPVEHRDNAQISTILKFLKQAYSAVGSIIIGAGLVLLPFIKYLIHVDIPMQQVYVYYLIYLFSSGINYLLNYRNVLFSANQDQYVITIASYLTWTILYIVQSVIIVATRSFLLYALAILAANVIKDIFLYIQSRKTFPEISVRGTEKLEPVIKDKIVKNVKGLISTRIGSMLVSTTDSVLISAMVSTAFLGLYSNYQMLLSGMRTLIVIIPEAATASIGNIGVTESNRKISNSFQKLDLGSFFIFSFLSIIFINTSTPIVKAFFGSDKIIPLSSLILLAVNFYLTSLREMLISYKSSLGLYWYDRKRPIVEGLTNLIVSIVLGKFMGFNGIILGTIITNLAINLVVEPRVIFHYGLKRSAFWYYWLQLGRFILFGIVSVISYAMCHYIVLPSFGNLVVNDFSVNISYVLQIGLNFIISSIVCGVIYFLVYHKNSDAKAIIDTLIIALRKKHKKN